MLLGIQIGSVTNDGNWFVGCFCRVIQGWFGKMGFPQAHFKDPCREECLHFQPTTAKRLLDRQIPDWHRNRNLRLENARSCFFTSCFYLFIYLIFGSFYLFTDYFRVLYWFYCCCGQFLRILVCLGDLLTWGFCAEITCHMNRLSNPSHLIPPHQPWSLARGADRPCARPGWGHLAVPATRTCLRLALTWAMPAQSRPSWSAARNLAQLFMSKKDKKETTERRHRVLTPVCQTNSWNLKWFLVKKESISKEREMTSYGP